MEYILEIKNLSKQYPGFLLDNINFQIPYGKIVGLIGENGAGKTTLINLILNQKKRDKGSIKVFGLNNIEKEKEIKKNIGFVVDECFFHDFLNSKDISYIMKSIYLDWNESYFEQLLKKFKLSKDKKISNMSKGMKSKLMLAIAMTHNPKLLILDEVTSGLDPVVRDDILDILEEFIKGQKKSVILSTHITSDLDKIVDYIIFLHSGKLIIMDEIENIRERFILIECNQKDLKNIDKEDIIAEYQKGIKYKLLVKRNSDDYKKIGVTPAIDDIMLIYSKGRIINDRIN